MKKTANICAKPSEKLTELLKSEAQRCGITKTAWVRLACKEKIVQDRKRMNAKEIYTEERL